MADWKSKAAKIIYVIIGVMAFATISLYAYMAYMNRSSEESKVNSMTHTPKIDKDLTDWAVLNNSMGNLPSLSVTDSDEYYINTGVSSIWTVENQMLTYDKENNGDNLGIIKQKVTTQNVRVEAVLNVSRDSLIGITSRSDEKAKSGAITILEPANRKVRFIKLPYVGELNTNFDVDIPIDYDFTLALELNNTEKGTQVKVEVDNKTVIEYVEEKVHFSGDYCGFFVFRGTGHISDYKVYSLDDSSGSGDKILVYSCDFSVSTDDLCYFPDNTKLGDISNTFEAVSNEFVIDRNYIRLYLGGKRVQEEVYLSVIDETGQELVKVLPKTLAMKINYLDVREFLGRKVKLKIADTSKRGYILVKDITQVEDTLISDYLSLLSSQVGYHTHDRKFAYLRSSENNPVKNPAEKQFFVTNSVTGGKIFTGKVSYWGEKWGSYWWTLDFSDMNEEGEYTIHVGEDELISAPFQIRNDILTNSKLNKADKQQVDLTMIAMDQLDERLKKFTDDGSIKLEGYTGEFIPGWRDCGTEIRELSSHVVSVHGLIDMFENSNIYNNLSAEYQKKLISQIRWGADYILWCQEKSDNPLYNGRFNHDGGGQTDYGTTGYHNWHGTAYAMTALVRTYFALQQSGEDSGKYLDAAELAYKNAVYRSCNLESDFRGRTDNNGNPVADDNFTQYVHELAQQVYNTPGDWQIPKSLKTKDKLLFTWACTLLYKATGEQRYFDTAVLFADSAAERQFTDWENPIEGVFGNFYAFEGDNQTFTLDWNQNHKFHMGNIEPTNLKGLMDLYTIAPQHEKAAKWYNTIKTYAEFYVKRSAELSPLGIYPLTVYSDEKYGGVKYFQVMNHGGVGMYGQIAKNMMEIGEFFNDMQYQVLANNNLQFVAGLNPGIPTSYAEEKWEPKSMIIGLGSNYFYAKHGLTAAPIGSGINGFSADVQFQPKKLGTVQDAPRGILFPDNSFQFNEDYLPHSHGYVSGVATMEDNFKLIVNTLKSGIPVDADAVLTIGNDKFNYKADNGKLVINDLLLMKEARIDIIYDGKTISKSFNTIGGAEKEIIIDFDTCVEMSLTVPETLNSRTAECILEVNNLGSKPQKLQVNLSADGVETSIASLDFNLKAGSKQTQTFTITAGCKVKPYTVLAATKSGAILYSAAGSGLVSSQAARKPDIFNMQVNCSEGGTANHMGQFTTTEGESLTIVAIPDSNYKVQDILVNGESQGNSVTCILTDISGDNVIDILFTKN